MSDQKRLKTQNHDVVIIGGGPVGLMTALLLCQRDFSVALVDQLDYKDVLKADFDGRTFAYAYGSKLILERAGIWGDLENVAEPITDIYVTSESTHASGNSDPKSGLHYCAKDVMGAGVSMGHKSFMGYNIETRHFRKTVFERLKSFDNFTLFAPDKVKNLSFEASHTEVILEGHILKAPLILACDGKNSFVRNHVGIESKQVPYDQKALVFLLDHEKPHNQTAYEHFLKAGPLAILPMKTTGDGVHHSGCIWSLSSDRADYYHALSNEDLSRELETHFKSILGDITVSGNRWLFPLDMTVVKRYIAPRLALIGDAAHSIHPVAGQGFNLGLRDAEALADTLENARSLGLDLGAQSLLETYEKSRKVDVLSMTSMCHGLVRLFSNDQKTVGHLRRAGLNITNAIPALKKKFTKHAMGL